MTFQRSVAPEFAWLGLLSAAAVLACTASAESGETSAEGRGSAGRGLAADTPVVDSAALARQAIIDSLGLERCAAAYAQLEDERKGEAARDSAARADFAAQLAAGDSTAQARLDSLDRIAAQRDTLWPVAEPERRAEAILPGCRIVAYYGNPLSRRMGILGEIPPDQMLARLDREVAAWERADSTRPVIPALHLVAVVAQADAGRDGKYRLRMTDSLIARVARWAERRNALVFLDVQLGYSTLEEELPRLEPWLRHPQFHLGLDPEFAMWGTVPPGKKIGTIDARHINYAIDFLSDIVEEHELPPKVLVVHRFTQGMVTNYDDVELDPDVQVVIDMDGWGPPRLKRSSWDRYIYPEPIQYAGFKLFYKNDTKAGHPLMTPEQVLRLEPDPVYIQYQ